MMRLEFPLFQAHVDIRTPYYYTYTCHRLHVQNKWQTPKKARDPMKIDLTSKLLERILKTSRPADHSLRAKV